MVILLVVSTNVVTGHANPLEVNQASNFYEWWEVEPNWQIGQRIHSFPQQLQDSEPTDYILSWMQFPMYRVGSPDGEVCGKVRKILSSGSNHELRSTCRPASNIPTTSSWVGWDFQDIYIDPTTPYEFYVTYTGTCQTCIKIVIDREGRYANGWVFQHDTFHYQEFSWDLEFRINGYHTPAIDFQQAYPLSVTDSGAGARIEWRIPDSSGLSNSCRTSWGTAPGVSDYDTGSWFSCGQGGSFYSSRTALKQNKVYYLKTCARNDAGQECLPEKTVTTNNRAPGQGIITSGPVLTQSGATFTGGFTDPRDDIKFQWDWGDSSGIVQTPSFWIGTGTSTVYDQEFKSWGSTGHYDVRIRGVDRAGATGAWSSPHRITVDKTPPVPPNLQSGDLSATNWVQRTADALFSWQSVDDWDNGVQMKTQYRLHDGTVWSDWSVPSATDTNPSRQIAVREGQHGVVVQVRDEAFNQVQDTFTYRVDNTPPTQATPYVVGSPNQVRNWFSEPVAIDVMWVDAHSGVPSSGRKVAAAGTTNWEAVPAAPRTVAIEGTTTWVGYAKDRAGNELSDPTILEVRIDLQDPTIFVDMPALIPWTADPDDLVFRMDFGDATSGLHRTEYQIRDELGKVVRDWTRIDDIPTEGTTFMARQYEVHPSLLIQGRNFMSVRATDWSGRVTTLTDAVEIQWDSVVPSRADVIVTSATEGENGWFTTDAALAVDSDDETSDIVNEWHRLGVDGEWTGGSSQDSWTDQAEGTRDWYGRAEDEASNLFVGPPKMVMIDKTPPTADSGVVGPLGDAAWYVGPVAITLNGADPVSGVERIEYRLDGDAWNTRHASNFNVEVAEDGHHELDFFVVDAAGWTAGTAETPNTVSVAIDATAPTSVFDITGTLGENGFYTSPTTVNVTATDATSGVREIRYNSGEGWGSEASTSRAFTFSDSGPHGVRFYAIDQAGNAEADGATANQAEIKVDVVPPTTNRFASATEGKRGWYTSPVELTLIGVDDYSGVAATWYGIDNASMPHAYHGPVTLSNEGVFAFSYRSVDLAGLREAPRTESYKVDTSAPELADWAQGPANLTAAHEGTLSFDVSVDPGPSGVWAAEFKYSTDSGSTWSTWLPLTHAGGANYTGEIPEPEPGWYIKKEEYLKYQVRVEDGAGNVDLSSIHEDWIDRTKPEMVLQSPMEGDEWGNGTRTVRWLARDRDHDDVTYRVFISDDNGQSFPVAPIGETRHAENKTWQNRTFTFDTSAFADLASYKMRVEALDGFALVAEDSGRFLIDNTAPTKRIVSPPAEAWAYTGTTTVPPPGGPLGAGPFDHTVVFGEVWLEAETTDPPSNLDGSRAGLDYIAFYVVDPDGRRELLVRHDGDDQQQRYGTSWDTTLLTPGNYRIEVEVPDEAGNERGLYVRELSVVRPQPDILGD